MHRVYLADYDGGPEITDSRAARHLTRALRVKPGDTFKGYDGRSEYLMKVESAARDAVRVEVLERKEAPAGARPSVAAAAALIKGKRWELLLQKLTELGVETIIPFAAERSVVSLDKEWAGAKTARWEKIVQAAVSQSGSLSAPAIGEPASFDDALRLGEAFEHKLILSGSKGNPSLKAYFSDRGPKSRAAKPGSCLLMIGPEGDFSPGELKRAAEAGFTAVHLGDRILRAETAAIVGAALAMHELGALECAGEEGE